MSKIALILSGFTRSCKSTFQALQKNLLDLYNIDIYISSWDVNQTRPKNKINPVTINIDQDEIIELYSKFNLKKYQFLSYDFYINNRFDSLKFNQRPNDIFKTSHRARSHGIFWIERLRDQWYQVKQAYQLIENPKEYDIIIKTRFDFLIQSKIMLHKDVFIIPKTDFNHDTNPSQYCDYFAYGANDMMKKYCLLFDYIEDIYNTYNIDISFGELMLKFYMEEYSDIKISTTIDNSIKYLIQR